MTKTLAATLKEIRKDRGWSQDDLATALGTTQSTISRYEDERLHTTWWDMHVRICELQATRPSFDGAALDAAMDAIDDAVGVNHSAAGQSNRVHYIKERREALGLSQEELAKAVGITRSAVSQWESGTTNPEMASLSLIAEALNCSTVDIFHDPGAPTPALSNLMQRPAAWDRDERDEYIEHLERINANLVQALAALHHLKKPRT